MGTNESGFTALPGGFRIYDYTATHYDYGYIGINGYWWSSTQNEGYEAWYYSMSDGNNFLTPFSSQLEWGYSVRCLQGENQPLLTINTKAISNITSTSVTTGGNVICNGSSSVISRGVCWNTSPSPTISNSFTKWLLVMEFMRHNRIITKYQVYIRHMRQAALELHMESIDYYHLQ